MYTNLLAAAQLSIEPDTVPVIFRIGFVFFLVLVMAWMKDEDQSKVKKVNH